MAFPGRLLDWRKPLEIKELTMKKLMSGLLATTLAASFAFASMVPANAAPIFVPNTKPPRATCRTCSTRPGAIGRHYNGVDRQLTRRRPVLSPRRHRLLQRPSRLPRISSRLPAYNGFWFPAGAFIAGALISGAINNAARSDNAARLMVLRPLPVVSRVGQYVPADERPSPGLLLALLLATALSKKPVPADRPARAFSLLNQPLCRNTATFCDLGFRNHAHPRPLVGRDK